jgi:hypothetical protein
METISNFSKRLLTICIVNSLVNILIISTLDKYSAFDYSIYLLFFGWIYASIVTVIFLKTIPKSEDVGPGDQVLAWIMINVSVYWCELILSQFAAIRF